MESVLNILRETAAAITLGLATIVATFAAEYFSHVIAATLGFGGFLGMNEKFHPLPWSTLDYQKGRDGYVVNMTKEQLEAAPSDGIDELTRGEGNTALREEVYDYYKAPRYWQ